MQQNPVSQKMLRHAMGKIPQIPTPTTADNGKTLGVENGAYALVEGGGGGGGQYLHCLVLEGSGGTAWQDLSFAQDGTFTFNTTYQTVSHVCARIIDDNPSEYNTTTKILSAIEAMPEMTSYPKGITCFVARSVWDIGLGTLYKRLSTPNLLYLASGAINVGSVPPQQNFEISFNLGIQITSSWTITDTVIPL